MRLLQGLRAQQIPGSNTVLQSGLTLLVRERDPDDPISEPDLTVQIRRALESSAGVTGGELRVHRVSNGLELGGLDPTVGADTTVSPVGYFGESAASDVRVVFLHDDFRPAEAQVRQTLTGTSVQMQLEPDDLIYTGAQAGSGVSYDTAGLVLTLAQAITGVSLYSYSKDQWRSVDGRTSTVFPLLGRAGDRLVLLNGWSFAAGSVSRLRGSGLEVWSGSGPDTVTARYANLRALASPGAGVTCYYVLGAGGSAVDLSAGTFDNMIDITASGGALVVRARPAGRTFASVDVVGVFGTLQAQSYGLTLLTEVDSNLQAGDVDNDAPYTGMLLTDHSGAPVSRTLNGVTDTFDRVIDAAGGSHLQAYTWGQHYLRQAANLTESDLFSVQGGSLVCEQGVYIDNLGSGQDSVVFRGLGGNTLQAPAYATVTLRFSDNLIGGDYRLDTGATWPGAGATPVQDVNNSPIGGIIPVGGVVTFSYDHAVNGDLAVHLAARNPGTARRVDLDGTIISGGLGLTANAIDETAAAWPASGAGSAIDGTAGTITPPGTFTQGSYPQLYRDAETWTDALMYRAAFRVSGGDDLGGGQSTDVDLFVQSGWSVVFGHSISFEDGGANLRADTGVADHIVAGAGVALVELPSSRRGLTTEVEGVSSTTAANVVTIKADVETLKRVEGLDPSNPVTHTVTRDSNGQVAEEVTTAGTLRRRGVYNGDVATRTREA